MRINGTDIDVLIPAYNYGRFLADCIDSVFAQTVQVGSVIVIDDGSTDDTPAIVEALGARYPIISIRRENRGLVSTLREAISLTSGRFFITLDADDRLAPTFVESCIRALARDKSVGYCYTQMALSGEESGVASVRSFSPRKLICSGNYIGGRAAMIRRDAYEQTRGYRDWPALEDWDLWLSFLDAGMVGAFIPEPLYEWHRHGNSRNSMTVLEERRLRRRIQFSHPRLMLRYYPAYLPIAAVNLVRRCI